MTKIRLKPSEWIKILVLLGVFVVGTYASYQKLKPKRVLPIYNPVDLNPAVVDDDLERVGRGHRVGDFDLVDQWGNKADSSLLQGKVYVADFFFTGKQMPFTLDGAHALAIGMHHLNRIDLRHNGVAH